MRPVRDQPVDATMSFGDHLDELRRRVLFALALPIPAAIVTFLLSDTLIQWLVLPLTRALRGQGLPEQLQVLGPAEAIIAELKLSLIASFIVSAPWIVWQVWLFIRPGLYRHERRFVYFLVPGSAILTVSGVALLYWVMLPIMLAVLVAIGAGVVPPTPPGEVDPRVADVLSGRPEIRILAAAPTPPLAGDVWLVWPDVDKAFCAVPGPAGGVEVLPLPRSGLPVIQQQFRLSEYINFVLVLMLGIVIAFQMPLVVVLLGWIGIASPAWLKEKRKYALMLCAVLAAVITPGSDLISMMLMLLPLYALYELGIMLLFIAPPHAVAEGTVFSVSRLFGRTPDKRAAGSNQPPEPVQSDTRVPRGRPDTSFTTHSPGERSDQEGERS